MSSHTPLSALADPFSLAKLQILLVPVHAHAPISKSTFHHYTEVIKGHQTLRTDELVPPFHPELPRGGGPNPRLRFFPHLTSPGGYGGHGRNGGGGGSGHQVHLTYTHSPPAKHLYPLSLFRISEFPLVVIGIAVDGEEDTFSRTQEHQEVEGYKLSDEEMEGDIGEGEATPTLPTSSKSKSASSQGALETAFDRTLSSLFPSTSPFPLVKRLVVVPNPNLGANARKERKGKGEGEVLYAPRQGLEQWITKLIGEVVGDALGELGVIVSLLGLICSRCTQEKLITR